MKTTLRAVIAIILFSSTLLIASGTTVFVPQKGFLTPDTFEGLGPNRGLGSLFQNSARTTGGRSHQVKFDTATDYLGYDRLSVSYLYHMPISRLTLGVGYYSFYTNDLIRTGVDDQAANGVSIGGNFGDSTSQTVFTLAQDLTEHFSMGSTIRYYSRTLDTASFSSFALDVGFTWERWRYLQLGLYTQNLIAGDADWDTDTIETLKRDVIAELGMSFSAIDLLITSDFDRRRLYGEYKMSPHLSITGDGLWGSGGDIIRNSFGALFHVGGLMLQYQHLNYDVPNLNFSQDVFGVALLFSPEQWLGIPSVY